jgi:hypothetical protein
MEDSNQRSEDHRDAAQSLTVVQQGISGIGDHVARHRYDDVPDAGHLIEAPIAEKYAGTHRHGQRGWPNHTF